MPFSDTLKWEVKQKAHFHCCWCQNVKVSLDAHHIIPECEGGPNTFDNAAPLCKNCHDTHGTNPNKRKEVRKRRDWWYKKCTEQAVMKQKLEEMYDVITDSASGVVTKINRLYSYTQELALRSNQSTSKLPFASPDEVPTIITDIAAASSTLNIVTNAIVNLSNYIFIDCPNCKSKITFSKSNTFQVCPNCGSWLRDSKDTYYTV